MKDMKLIMENWNRFSEQQLNEKDIEIIPPRTLLTGIILALAVGILYKRYPQNNFFKEKAQQAQQLLKPSPKVEKLKKDPKVLDKAKKLAKHIKQVQDATNLKDLNVGSAADLTKALSGADSRPADVKDLLNKKNIRES